MKIVAKTQEPVITYTVVVDISFSGVSTIIAGKYVDISNPKYPASTFSKMSREDKDHFEDAIDNVIGVVISEGFKFEEDLSHQSNISYSYYAFFTLTDGELAKFQMIFRLSDHTEKRSNNRLDLKNGKIQRTIYVTADNMKSEFMGQKEALKYCKEFKRMIAEYNELALESENFIDGK